MRRSSGRDKHSFIQFYFDDWKAGTAHMARPVRSVYFDICLYTWDKRKAVGRGALKLMIADLGEQGQAIVDALVDEGTLLTNAAGEVWSPRALAEAERAWAAWDGKSRGGKLARGVLEDSCNNDAAKSRACSTEPEPEPEPEPEDSPDGESIDGGPSDKKATKPAMQMIVDQWNDTASQCGLSTIIKMSEPRIAALKARIGEHGANALLDGIRSIPESHFLTGKTKEGFKAHFDWFVQASSCLKLLEGMYHARGQKGGAWSEN